MNPTKFYISRATGSVYWLDGDSIMFVPISTDNTFDLSEAGEADEELFGDEHVYPPETENFLKFSDVYAQVRKALS